MEHFRANHAVTGIPIYHTSRTVSVTAAQAQRCDKTGTFSAFPWPQHSVFRVSYTHSMCTVAIYLVREQRENVWGEKEQQHHSACTILIDVRTRMAEESWPVTALWVARRWPFIASTPWLTVPLSPLCKVPLKCWGRFSAKVRVAWAQRESSRIEVEGCLSNFLFIGERCRNQ